MMLKKGHKSNRDKILKKLTEKEIQQQLYGYIEEEEQILTKNPLSVSEILSQAAKTTASAGKTDEMFIQSPTLSRVPRKGNIYKYQANRKDFRKVIIILIWFMIIGIIAVTVIYIAKALVIRPQLRHVSTLTASEAVAVKKPYTIQVAIYENQQDANAVADSLNKKGYKAAVFKTTSSKGKMHYRIYVGEFKDMQEAEEFLDSLKSDGKFKDAFARYR